MAGDQITAGGGANPKEEDERSHEGEAALPLLGNKLAALLLLDNKDTDTNLNPDSNLHSPLKGLNDADEWPPCPTPFPDLKPPATWAAVQAMAPPPPSVTVRSEVLAKAANIQRSAIKATKKFFSALKEDFGSESDDEPGSESESEYEFDYSDSGFELQPDMDEFFDSIFENDHKLKEYYKNNPEKGDFYCFICQVREDFKGKGMRYKSGLALVQHANTVYKAGWTGAHRALARAVCRVLGWDPVNIPGKTVSSPSSEVEADADDSGTKDKKEADAA